MSRQADEARFCSYLTGADRDELLRYVSALDDEEMDAIVYRADSVPSPFSFASHTLGRFRTGVPFHYFRALFAFSHEEVCLAYEAGVPAEYVRLLGVREENGLNLEHASAAYEAGVPWPYIVEMRERGLTRDGDCVTMWQAGVSIEYVREVYRRGA